MNLPVDFDRETIDKCQLDAPLCIAPTMAVREALEYMKDQNCAAVLICRERVVTGIFTERDALKMMATGADFAVPIQQVMTPNPVALRPSDTVGAAIAAMTRGGYRRLPIVDAAGRATGMIKVESILHYLVEHFPKVIYNLPPEPHHSTQQREGA